MTSTVELNIRDLRETLERMAAVLEQYRKDAVTLRFRLNEAVEYADGSAKMDGMPEGKQCKRLTFTHLEDGVSVTKVWDVSAARETVRATEYLREQLMSTHG